MWWAWHLHCHGLAFGDHKGGFMQHLGSRAGPCGLSAQGATREKSAQCCMLCPPTPLSMYACIKGIGPSIKGFGRVWRWPPFELGQCCSPIPHPNPPSGLAVSCLQWFVGCIRLFISRSRHPLPVLPPGALFPVTVLQVYQQLVHLHTEGCGRMLPPACRASRTPGGC